MSQIKVTVTMIVGILFVGALTKVVQANDFDEARAAIDAVAPNINYTDFCRTIFIGSDKLICRIRSVPTVGFLLCKQPTVDGIPCNDAIMTEVNSLVQLANSGVPTVVVKLPQINNIVCGQNDSTDCSGYIQRWVIGGVDGNFESIRDHIVDGTLEDLIDDVEDSTNTGTGLTASSLVTIRNYMSPGQNVYRQICDLEGIFFLQNGEFVVNDVEAIGENIGLDGVCDNGEPTTQQVLSALDRMIMAFGGKPCVENSAIVMTVTVWMLCLEILIVAMIF